MLIQLHVKICVGTNDWSLKGLEGYIWALWKYVWFRVYAGKLSILVSVWGNSTWGLVVLIETRSISARLYQVGKVSLSLILFSLLLNAFRFIFRTFTFRSIGWRKLNIYMVLLFLMWTLQSFRNNSRNCARVQRFFLADSFAWFLSLNGGLIALFTNIHFNMLTLFFSGWWFHRVILRSPLIRIREVVSFLSLLKTNLIVYQWGLRRIYRRVYDWESPQL